MSHSINTLRNMMDATRKIANSYIKKLEGKDVRQSFEVTGIQLNSAYWLVGHMAWAQNNLIIRSFGGPNPEVKWLKHFGMGKAHQESLDNGPSWEELVEGFHKVHEVAMNHLSTLNDATLDEENLINWEVPGLVSKSKGATLIHHIRHEGMHVGHLGWIAKLHGIRGI
jgi:DinB superfamily